MCVCKYLLVYSHGNRIVDGNFIGGDVVNANAIDTKSLMRTSRIGGSGTGSGSGTGTGTGTDAGAGTGSVADGNIESVDIDMSSIWNNTDDIAFQ
jgi:hypothetical protein